MHKAPTTQTIPAWNSKSLKLRRGIGAFASRDFKIGQRVSDLTGTWTYDPPEDDAIQQSYIVEIEGHEPPYLDQRYSNHPDACVQISTSLTRCNVTLDTRAERAGYWAVKNIKSGEEILLHGSKVAVYAGIVHQAQQLTPAGQHATSTLRIAQSTIPGAGIGLFAKSDLPIGWMIGAYTGQRKPMSDGPGGPYEFMVKGAGGYIVDGQLPSRSSILRYVNHKDETEANVMFQQMSTIGLVAFTTKSVSAGSELFASYGEDAQAVIEASGAQAAKNFLPKPLNPRQIAAIEKLFLKPS